MPNPKRFALNPNNSGKRFALTSAMIERRDAIATALGYILRPCSIGPNPRSGAHRQCWEYPGLSYDYRGKMISDYHSIRTSREEDGAILYHWPEQAEVAGHAIDKGKPLAGDAGDAPAEVAGSLSFGDGGEG